MKLKNNERFDIDLYGNVFDTKRKKFVVPHIDRQGYEVVRIGNTKKGIHRLMAETWLENPEDLPVVNHMNGNKLDNSLDNLEWCTYSHNNKEAYRLGLNKGNEKGINGK